MERPATILEIYECAPHFLEYAEVRFELRALRSVARWLARIANRLETARPPPVLQAQDIAEDLAETRDAIAAVLRDANPMLVCGRFAIDSPLRSVPKGE